MRKLILRMLLTLDGAAAGLNGPLDMVDYGDEGSWKDIFPTLETVDAMLIGGASHNEYLSYWHKTLTDRSASPNEKKYAEIATRTPHFVLSRTLEKVDWPNASVLPGGVDGIPDLKHQAGGDIVLWGGPTVAGAAAEAGFIDEYHLEVHPAIAGRSKKLFEKVDRTQRLRHLDTTTFPSGVLVVKYARAE